MSSNDYGSTCSRRAFGRITTLTRVITMTVLVGVLGVAHADSYETSAERHRGFAVGIAATLGEGFYVIDDKGYRGPFSLEAVGSIGWYWFKLDLGLYTTFEHLYLADTRAGYWSFQVRPGMRITPPIVPLYLRFALPLVIQKDDFDWGVLLGLGVDIPVGRVVGIVFELDVTLTDHLDWGGRGFPMEFRAGVSFRL